MSLGDLRDGTGLTNLLFEVVGNVIDQRLMGRASKPGLRLRQGEALVEEDQRMGIDRSPFAPA